MQLTRPTARLSVTEPQALVCAGMRCSLPVSDPEGLERQIGEMLASNR